MLIPRPLTSCRQRNTVIEMSRRLLINCFPKSNQCRRNFILLLFTKAFSTNKPELQFTRRLLIYPCFICEVLLHGHKVKNYFVWDTLCHKYILDLPKDVFHTFQDPILLLHYITFPFIPSNQNFQKLSNNN